MTRPRPTAVRRGGGRSPRSPGRWGRRSSVPSEVPSQEGEQGFVVRPVELPELLAHLPVHRQALDLVVPLRSDQRVPGDAEEVTRLVEDGLWFGVQVLA